ncbi:lipopolysaccharide biosynthesis protein [Sulfurifustis variabilis]|uniref:Lipopolysaccharide biosynthesis protein n=1 Tax=Sulfurifustis variabilis TaxID=1675686 RepID=A0A1B4V3D7_9GAMM|nr:lipopolysaccharide biosynthesis protein [Sulfurifustis variabilis]BAU48073.1 lipopolysaccharide biosynthesis protein [Sulfurifustis variabilis]
MDGSTHLSDYLAVLKRRRRQVIYTAAAIFALFALLAVALPPVYRSTAKLLIEQQQIPTDVVSSTVTGYVNQRIRVIETRVLKPEHLAQVAESVGLYPEERAAGDVRAVAAKMRGNIKTETVSANVTDPRSGASSMATIAFNVSFDAPSPELAQKTAEQLAGLFIRENQKVRTQKAERASGFLGDEEERLRQHIAELETRLAAYKEKYSGRLPELMNLNMQLFERTERELEELDHQIVNLEERKLQLQSQLALLEPHTGNSPGGRLREVQTQYMTAAAVYAPDHPDVMRLKRELDTLKKQTGVPDNRAPLERQYSKAKGQLNALREKYADDHPDIARLEKTVASLEERLRRADSDVAGMALKPDNPAYVAVQTQLDALNLSLKAAREQQVRAREKLNEYKARLEQTPQVEQEGLALQREYESAVKKYREIKQNLMNAELAVELERGQQGEHYSLLEPPEMPDAPQRPNRRAFLLLGLVLGLGSGVGYASVAEYMDRTVRGRRALRSLVDAPLLAAIPYIPNGGDPGFRRA